MCVIDSRITIKEQITQLKEELQDQRNLTNFLFIVLCFWAIASIVLILTFGKVL